MKSKIYFLSIVIFITGLVLAGNFLYTKPVLAQDNLSVWGDQTSGLTIGFEAFKVIGLGNRDPRLIIASVVQIILGFLGVLTILLILYSGFMWMTANGNEEKVQTAKDLLKNAVIGILIILSAFAIATFILRALIGSTGGLYNNTSGGNSNGGGALSAIGGGIISSVYPTPNQREVPRNTAVIITFKEKINPATICDKVTADKCNSDAKILPDSIKIFQTNLADKKETNLTDVRVASSDNKTFVFSSTAYLGSPTEKLWYTIALTTKIMKADKAKAFPLSGFAWQFEVSDILDLTPPKVLSAGVFPPPDNEQDQPGQIIDAKYAQASLLVNAQPRVFRAWRVTYSKINPNFIDLAISNPKNNICDGQVDITINNTNPVTAYVAYRNLPGRVDEAEAPIINQKIQTACGFEVGILNAADNFKVGESWRLDLATQKSADSLVIGAESYSFVDKITGAKQILVGSNTAETATNMVTALANNKDTNASLDTVNINKVNLEAKVAGRIGNLTELLTTAVRDAITISPFVGGTDKIVSLKVMDKSDKPKNAIIQINFNEAINPLTLSGRSEDIAKNIQVINLSDGSKPVSGEFRLSNQYKTVEFFPDQECGINGCGEKIYCLPASSNLRVELLVASLNVTCATEADCVTRAPFSACQENVCYDLANTAFYPEGKLGTGIVDLAQNSLDGNRDGKAVGPKDYFIENTNLGAGDNFAWSFWTTNGLDLTPPSLVEIIPTYNQSKVGLSDPITIKFNKLMISSSLATGSILSKKGTEEIEQQLINLRSLAKSSLGYWLENYNEEISNPPDSEADRTVVILNHSPLVGSNKYRAQVGSGVKDIYQNCYKPCAGPSCNANSNEPSCCNGVPKDLGAAPICEE